MSAPPLWATALLARVAADEGRTDVPTLVWRRAGKPRPVYPGWPRTRPRTSSGHWNARDHRIVVTAGSERRDQKLVLLHEAAHWLAPKGDWHSDGFWITCFALFRRYGVPMRYARQRSLAYLKGAAVGIAADRARAA